jgi:ubiquinone/menaquinone biosynthesis C-methylase UbiE
LSNCNNVSANGKKESDNQSWNSWQSTLDVFEGWLEEEHSTLIRAWWVYLYNKFVSLASRYVNSGETCVDIGCGAGGCLYAIVTKRKCQGVGLDPLRSSLKSFKKLTKATNISDSIHLVQGVSEFLPFRDNYFQLCTMTGSLDHVKSTEQTVSEFFRILAPSHYLVLEETALRVKKKNCKSFFQQTHNVQFTKGFLVKLFNNFRITKTYQKYPVFSQLEIPDVILEYSFVHTLLSRAPGVIGMLFNHSEVMIECQKT